MIIGDWVDNFIGVFIELDMVLILDFSIVIVVFWMVDVILQVIYDVMNQLGELVLIVLCNVFKCVVELYCVKGWIFIVVFEMEFFLVVCNIDFNQLIILFMGCLGCWVVVKQVYFMLVVDEYGKVIDDIYDFVEVQGFEIDGILQEGGVGQVEINLNYGDLVYLVDQIFYFKCLICEVVLCYDCFVIFMVKFIENELGSVMYIYYLVVGVQDGCNIFLDDQGCEMVVFMYFIGGMQWYLFVVIVLLVFYVNSYCCYVFDFVVLINLEWGCDNCMIGLCVLIFGFEVWWVENWLVGMDCNFYLGLVVSLVCGYLGLIEQENLCVECLGDVYMLQDELFYNFGDVLDLMEENEVMCEVLGVEFVVIYQLVKCNEYKEFLQVISLWECEYLLLNV